MNNKKRKKGERESSRRVQNVQNSFMITVCASMVHKSYHMTAFQDRGWVSLEPRCELQTPTSDMFFDRQAEGIRIVSLLDHFPKVRRNQSSQSGRLATKPGWSTTNQSTCISLFLSSTSLSAPAMIVALSSLYTTVLPKLMKTVGFCSSQVLSSASCSAMGATDTAMGPTDDTFFGTNSRGILAPGIVWVIQGASSLRRLKKSSGFLMPFSTRNSLFALTSGM